MLIKVIQYISFSFKKNNNNNALGNIKCMYKEAVKEWGRKSRINELNLYNKWLMIMNCEIKENNLKLIVV